MRLTLTERSEFRPLQEHLDQTGHRTYQLLHVTGEPALVLCDSSYDDGRRCEAAWTLKECSGG